MKQSRQQAIEAALFGAQEILDLLAPLRSAYAELQPDYRMELQETEDALRSQAAVCGKLRFLSASEGRAR